MLAIVSINNEEKVVYTVPQNKKAKVYFYVFMLELGLLTVKINDYVYFEGQNIEYFYEKLFLDAGDTIKVSSNVRANVFVNGVEENA